MTISTARREKKPRISLQVARLEIRIPPGERADADLAAKRRGVTFSEFVREAIREKVMETPVRTNRGKKAEVEAKEAPVVRTIDQKDVIAVRTETSPVRTLAEPVVSAEDKWSGVLPVGNPRQRAADEEREKLRQQRVDEKLLGAK